MTKQKSGTKVSIEALRKLPQFSGAARLWDRAFMKLNGAFRTQDGTRYDVQPNGAFVGPGKDPRTVKARKRARRELRAQSAA